MYFVRYWYNGKEVKLLLDDQISKDYTRKAFDDVLGANGKLDYIFIGHMHFDHDGECPLHLPLNFKREPLDSLNCFPFQEQAANYSAKVVAPLYGCKLTKPGTNCTAVLPSPTSPQVLDFPEIGLRVTAIPNAHSYLGPLAPGRGAPGCDGGITGLACPDAFAYLFEFPGETGSQKECASSFFWANTAHDRKPFLEGNSETGDPSLAPLNYSQLLKQGFSQQAFVRSILMAFPGHFLPDEQAWQEWAQIVRPLYHTTHHHGDIFDGLWPDLPSKLRGGFEGLGSPNATWLPSAEIPAAGAFPAYKPTFLPQKDFFNTFRMRGSTVQNVDLGYANKFRSHFTARSLLV